MTRYCDLHNTILAYIVRLFKSVQNPRKNGQFAPCFSLIF